MYPFQLWFSLDICPGMGLLDHMITPFFVCFLSSLNTVLHRLPWWLSGKEFACQCRDVCSIPGSGRSPGEGNGNSLSILAWAISWSLADYSMWSQTISHDLAAKNQLQQILFSILTAYIPINSVGGFSPLNFYDRYKLYHTNHSPSHQTLLVLMCVYSPHLVLVVV